MNTEPLFSRFRDDPDYQELLAGFVAEMADRRQALTQAFAAGSWDELRRYAHQLKGAGGGYGYDSLTSVATDLEVACRKVLPDPDELARLLDHVLDLMSRLAA